jgi:AraC family transcriptional activator of pobA
MHLIHIAPRTKGKLIFTHQEVASVHFDKADLGNEQILTIALNGEETQQITINGMFYEFPPFCIVPLVSGQVFKFEKPEMITAWQYSRDFYCLVDNYFEISCLGLLFFGFRGNLFLTLDEAYREKLRGLQQLFLEEFNTVDTIQTDMLQMLLKRLIILVTRLAKEQYLGGKVFEEEKFDIIRQFNLLVDQDYKSQHQVSYYADRLNKSAKTLTRIFTGFNYSTPSMLIQERIIIEAKRLFCYTHLSVKEIAYDLGFNDAAHFSRFFKNTANLNPSDYRKQQLPI